MARMTSPEPVQKPKSPPPPRPAPTLEWQRRDTEIAVAIFRTVFLLIILTSRPLFETPNTSTLLTIAVIAAAGYNLALFVLHYRNIDFPRSTIIIIDLV